MGAKRTVVDHAMAGHAEKKLAKKAENNIQYYLGAIIGVNVLYILWRVLYHWRTMGFWHIMGFGLFSLVSYLTYCGINNALQLGVPFEYYFDLFCVNLVSQFLVTFSNWGWLLYLTVPGFALYKIGGLIANYVFTPTAEEEAANDPKAQKRLAKKERQAERPKFKVS